MVEFIKLAKNPRIGFRNAVLITRDLLRRRQEIRLEPTEWYDKISLRPNNSDYEVFNRVLDLKMNVCGVPFDEKGLYMDIGTAKELDAALKKFHLKKFVRLSLWNLQKNLLA